MENAYPMYATPAQNLVVKFIYNDPLPLIHTSLIIKPNAMDGQNSYRNDRMYTNQLTNTMVLTSNIANMKHVLFYNKYIFDARLIEIIKKHSLYAWILKSYERTATTITQNK